MQTDPIAEQLPSQTWTPAADTDGPGKDGPIVIWRDGAAQQTQCRWGLRPRGPGLEPISLLRAEGRLIDRRCLLIATEFYVTERTGRTTKRHRVTFNTQAPFFCFAGVWQPATSDWPVAYAGLTVDASPDIAPYKDRQMAVVSEEDWQAWLDGTLPTEALSRPLRVGSFAVENTDHAGVIGDLFD